jgi:hypothetical protein
MCHTESAGEEDNERKMKPYAMMERENLSLTEEFCQILQDPSRIEGVGGDKKSAKRQANKKIRERVYFVQKEEEVSHQKLKYTCKLKPGKRSGLRAMYNIRADSRLRVGFVLV